MDEELPPHSRAYTHYKTGDVYDMVGDDMLIEATKERAVAYRSRRTGATWVRTFSDFHALVEIEGGRFVPRFAEFPEPQRLPRRDRVDS